MTNRAVIRVDVTPPSMNTNAVRSRWATFHRLKKSWQANFEMLLLAGAVYFVLSYAASSAVRRWQRRLAT